MTEILCRWLNEDVQVAPKLSKSVTCEYPCSPFLCHTLSDDGNLAEHFSNGYLFGEVLSKHGLQVSHYPSQLQEHYMYVCLTLQEDFTQFSKGK